MKRMIKETMEEKIEEEIKWRENIERKMENMRKEMEKMH